MKPILPFIVLIFSLFFQQEPIRLKGAYKMEYDSKYQLQNSQITFNDSTFVKKLPDGFASKGTVVYTKHRVTLKYKNDNPIDIDGRELAKDTINFTTKSKTDNSMTINRGRMIRIKP